jgi:hypothetical protein
VNRTAELNFGIPGICRRYFNALAIFDRFGRLIIFNVKVLVPISDPAAQIPRTLTGRLGAAPTVDAIVTDRALHEIYLPAFRAAVIEAHDGSVMCSYNEVFGVCA